MTNRATALFERTKIIKKKFAPVSAGRRRPSRLPGYPAGARDGLAPPPTILNAFYVGNNRNDLLTAGLGDRGLGSMTPPGFADALHPTAEELRRSAIFGNYRASWSDTTRSRGNCRRWRCAAAPPQSDAVRQRSREASCCRARPCRVRRSTGRSYCRRRMRARSSAAA